MWPKLIAQLFELLPHVTRLVPVAMLGVAGYALIGVLALMGRWWLAFEAAQIGFMFALFLSYIEAFVLEKWCIYCLWSQGIITAILLLTIGALVVRWRGRGAAFEG